MYYTRINSRSLLSSFVCFTTLLVASCGQAADPVLSKEVLITPDALNSEVFYEIQYRIDCGDQTSSQFPGILGTFELSKPTPAKIRFELYQGKAKTRISLGNTSEPAVGKVTLEQADASHPCRIISIRDSIVKENISGAALTQTALHALAIKHSPYLVVRTDQYLNRLTDIPLDMVYSTHPGATPGTTALKYTVFFSDEDSKGSANAERGQLGRYNRTTDIEWLYQVTFDDKGFVVDEKYQGGAFDKLKTGQGKGDHSELTMSGGYWPGTLHPILFNVAKNNTFSDRPSGKQKTEYVAYHLGLLPSHRVDSPDAREDFQLSSEGRYMYTVSERELIREKKSPGLLSDYLMLRVQGTLLPNDTLGNWNNGAFLPMVRLESNAGIGFQAIEFKAGENVDRLGEDMHQKAAASAVQVGKANLDLLAAGKISALLTFKDDRRAGWTQEFTIARADVFRFNWSDTLLRYEIEWLLEKHTPKKGASGFAEKIAVKGN